MKFITLLFNLLLSSVIFSSQAFAHTDHALGEGSVHALYHIFFWTIFAIVIYKAYTWVKNKKSQKSL